MQLRLYNTLLTALGFAILWFAIPASAQDLYVLRAPRDAAGDRTACTDADGNTHPGENHPFMLGIENIIVGKAKNPDGTPHGQHLARVVGGVATQIVPPVDAAKRAAFQAILDHPIEDGVVIDYCIDRRDAGSLIFVWLHKGQTYFRGWINHDEGSGLYRYRIADGKITRLTEQKFHDHEDLRLIESMGRNRDGTIRWAGVFHAYPLVIPGGDIMFSSNRRGYMSHRLAMRPRESHAHRRMGRIHRMDEWGKNIRDEMGLMNMGYMGAINLRLNPWTGEIGFMSSESAMQRGDRMWSFWGMNPDGTGWKPYFTGFEGGVANGADSGFNWFEFGHDKNVFGSYYYGAKNKGQGNGLRFKFDAHHGSEQASDNPALTNNGKAFGPFPFQPKGTDSPLGTVLDWEDTGRAIAGGVTAAEHNAALASPIGKASHWSPDDQGRMMYTLGKWYGGGANFNMVTSQIWAMKSDGDISTNKVLYRDDNYYLWRPQVAKTWKQIYGVDPPEHKSTVSSEAALVTWVGTSGVDERQSEGSDVRIGDDGKPFWIGWRDTNRLNAGWRNGGDTLIGNGLTVAQRLADLNKKVYYVRLVSQYSVRAHKSHPTLGVNMLANGEVWGVLAEFRVTGRGVTYQGTTIRDTSFLVEMIANGTYTFQILDEWKRVITHAPTWHQGMPGERRTNCNGCHFHSDGGGREFAGTYAALNPSAMIKTLGTKSRIVTWEDVRGRVEQHCGTCHKEGEQAGAVWTMANLFEKKDVLRPHFSMKSGIVSELVKGTMPPSGSGTLDSQARKALVADLATFIDMGGPLDAKAKIDQEPPVVNIVSPLPRSKASVLRFAVADRQSDIKDVFAWRNGATIGLTKSVNKYGQDVYTHDFGSEIDSGTVTVRVVDTSGNSYRREVTLGKKDGDVIIDPPPPEKDWKKLFEKYLLEIEDLARRMRAELGQ